jgi:hypothetical protein
MENKEQEKCYMVEGYSTKLNKKNEFVRDKNGKPKLFPQTHFVKNPTKLLGKFAIDKVTQVYTRQGKYVIHITPDIVLYDETANRDKDKRKSVGEVLTGMKFN